MTTRPLNKEDVHNKADVHILGKGLQTTDYVSIENVLSALAWAEEQIDLYDKLVKSMNIFPEFNRGREKGIHKCRKVLRQAFEKVKE